MKFEIGKDTIYSKSFVGRDDIILWDVIKINKEQTLKIKFISTNSKHKQGIRIAIDTGEGFIEVNGQRLKSIQLWENTSPKELLIKCYSSTGLLSIYNIWDEDKGAQSMAHTSGMIINETNNIRVYHCNDFGNDMNFEKLVFSIEKIVN
jgi:hypothetical protein